MPDPIFADARLAAVYDALDGPRDDLSAYRQIARDIGARRVLDIGCGTGSLALLLADDGCEVTALDPAQASVDVARAKPGAARVRWVVGEAADARASDVELVTMTGNVAQAIADPDAWRATLDAASKALAHGGHLVFEARDPVARAWEEWTRDRSHRVVATDAGRVESWVELIEVALPLVRFRWTFVFHEDGAVLTSDSTLRFRERHEIEAQLDHAGFSVQEVRDAPDRPRRELVFVARRLAR